MLKSLQIVTADGVIRSIRENDTDWMWLVRGAASAFPAVVLSMTLQLQPLKPIIREQTNVLSLYQFAPLVRSLSVLQCAGKLSRHAERSVILACAPPFLHETLSEVPDKVCLYNVYIMAGSEAEFEAIVREDDGVNKSFLYQSDWTDRTLSELTNAVGNAYPPGLAWDTRSYQMETQHYDRVDWDSLRLKFERLAPKQGFTHVLTTIGPDTMFASGGGAYGTSLPALVVNGYSATDLMEDDKVRRSGRAMLDSTSSDTRCCAGCADRLIYA